MRVRNSQPFARPPVVDRLAFLLPWTFAPSLDPGSTYARLRHRIEKEIERGVCQRTVLRGTRYRHCFSILLPSGAKFLLQIGAFDSARKKGDVRVDMNPAKFAAGDIAALRRILGRIIGPGRLDILLRKALLHRVDFAVDVLHADLGEMLVAYSNVQRFSMFCKRVDTKGNVEGYNFGSVSSNYISAVYSKDIERAHRAVLQMIKEGLKTEPLEANMIKQLKQLCGAPSMMRIEVRGRKLSNLPLHGLRNEANRFERFKFAHLGTSGADLPVWLEAAFLSLCRERGVKAALATFRNTEYARLVHKFWQTRQCSWWQPEELWQQACDALEGLGIFPVEAFDPNDTPLKEDSARPCVDFIESPVAKPAASHPSLAKSKCPLSAHPHESGSRRKQIPRINGKKIPMTGSTLR